MPKYFSSVLPICIATAVSITSVSCSTPIAVQTQNTSTPTVNNDIAETVTPTFAPTSTLQNLIDFQNAIKAFNIDLSCTIVCWNNFIPGTTSMKDVISWMVQLNNRGTPQPENSYELFNLSGATYKSPNTFISPTQGDVSLGFMSDETQPIPLLRAYYINTVIASC